MSALTDRKRHIKRRIKAWRSVAIPRANKRTPSQTYLFDLKQTRLAEFEEELAGMKEHGSTDSAKGGTFISPDFKAHFLAYPEAMRMLDQRLDATKDELAAWVWTGEIAAYLNVNGMEPPLHFHYDAGYVKNFDYIAPLTPCWFIKEEITRFEPGERYKTGSELIERWEKRAGTCLDTTPEIEAYIQAKASESRLSAFHPCFGVIQKSFPGDDTYPPLESELFVLSQIEAIEAEDFGVDTTDRPSKSKRNHDPVLQGLANEIAKREMKMPGQTVTKYDVAMILAERCGRNLGTVLRNIKKKW